jgi:hypothetical protein
MHLQIFCFHTGKNLVRLTHKLLLVQNSWHKNLGAAYTRANMVLACSLWSLKISDWCDTVCVIIMLDFIHHLMFSKWKEWCFRSRTNFRNIIILILKSFRQWTGQDGLFQAVIRRFKWGSHAFPSSHMHPTTLISVLFMLCIVFFCPLATVASEHPPHFPRLNCAAHNVICDSFFFHSTFILSL